MNIKYTLDDSAARLPLAIRSPEGVMDRVSDLRNSAGIHLVELTTQHMLSMGFTLTDELTHYFDEGHATEADPYELGTCYTHRRAYEDLLRDLTDPRPGLAALHEVDELFPASFKPDLQFLLALTVVGYPAFGYVRAYYDSEGETYHGMVINIAQARPHVEEFTGEYSLARLTNLIRYGFFNHEGFLLAYDTFYQTQGYNLDTFVWRLKTRLMSRGIAWYLSYRHDAAFYDELLGIDAARMVDYVAYVNRMLADARNKRALDDAVFEGWYREHETGQPVEQCVDMVGYYAASAIAAEHGLNGLRDAIERGPNHFLALYNALDVPPLESRARSGE
ncbi:MAG: hypothetical protein JXA10_18115 [Anaerolineae bacterium]|nr:hypothetical protein [Anaerolineae bacterium]